MTKNSWPVLKKYKSIALHIGSFSSEKLVVEWVLCLTAVACQRSNSWEIFRVNLQKWSYKLHWYSADSWAILDMMRATRIKSVPKLKPVFGRIGCQQARQMAISNGQSFLGSGRNQLIKLPPTWNEGSP